MKHDGERTYETGTEAGGATDAAGRPIAPAADPAYDAEGRRTAAYDADGRRTAAYDTADGRRTAAYDTAGRPAAAAGYDAEGRPVAAPAAAPVYAEPPVIPRGGGLATAALVFGILALVTSFTVVGGVVLGILALIFGFMGRSRARRGLAYGRGRAMFGILTGLLAIIIAIVLVVFGWSILNTRAGKNLQSCLKSAGTNQTAIQQCAKQYRSNTTNGS